MTTALEAPRPAATARGRVGSRGAAALPRALGAEALGTFVMVAIGTGSVAAAVLLGWPERLWQIALIWAGGVFLGIRVSARHSGAHLNPAVSLALAAFRPESFPRRRVLPYWGAQLLGAVAAGALVLALFGARLTAFEAGQGLVRGAPGSERAARMFGEYFPNPGRVGAAPVAHTEALAWEALGTAALLLVVFLVSDPRRRLAARPWLAQVLVALTVAAVIVVVAPVTQCGINPARDFGPRLVAWAAGFGSIAIPGPHGGFWVYLAGPLLGGLAGAAVSSLVPSARKPVVLFVCVHNAGRSQMAAAFARSLGGPAVDVRSAGSAPGERVHPNVRAAMAELGLVLDTAPRRLTDDDLAAADVVVTMGCGDECVAKAGARREDWVLDDPAGKDLATTRRIRDEIRRRVAVLLAGLRGPLTAPGAPG